MSEPARTDVPITQDPAELVDKYHRALAELENHRKRAAKEIAQARTEGEERALGAIVELYDDFIRALRAIEDTKGRNTKAQVLEGVGLLFDKFKNVLQRLDVEGFAAEGQQFSASIMDAIAQVPSRTLPPGTVAEQVSQGFTRRGKLLRPAQVVVAVQGQDDAEEREDP